MCTVTFVARQNGFALGMNRDEKLTRPAALAPRCERVGPRHALFPSEPGGGTWIGVNDAGVCFALVNWYSVPARRQGASVTRGIVTRSLLSAGSTVEAEAIFGRLPLNRVNPFRVTGFFSADKQVVEWQWNLRELRAVSHRWTTNTWISSGFDERGAQKARGQTFADALQQESAGTLGWLRRLHGSHQPHCGPYSTCMHRADAKTVSYTEIVASSREIVTRYGGDCLCRGPLFHESKLMIQPLNAAAAVRARPRSAARVAGRVNEALNGRTADLPVRESLTD